MRKLILLSLLFVLIFSNIAYAQQDFLYITVDISADTIITESDYDIQTEFSTKDFIQDIGNENLFIFSYNSESDFDNFKLKVILPEESIISEREDILLVSRPVQISSDGRRIYLEWSGELENGEHFTTFAQYKTEEFETNYYLLLITAFFITFLVGYNVKKFKKNKFIKSVLSEDEKKIVKIIKKENEITQNELKKKLDWSKTKVSKVVRNLEMKNLIIKIPYKKTNKIKLK